MTRRLACALATCLPVVMIAAQAAPPAATLLVLSKADQVLSSVDPASLAVVGRAPSGPDPHEVVASDDGRRAYVANYNGGGNVISVIDLVAMKALDRIDLGALRAPHGLAFAGGRVWFTAERSQAVGSYDPATGAVRTELRTGQEGTHMVVVSADQRRLVTTNMGSAGKTGPASVTIAERIAGSAASGDSWRTTHVPVGAGAEGFDVSPDGATIWVASAATGTVSVIDVATRSVIATLPAGVTGANRLKFTPDGRRVLVSRLLNALGDPSAAEAPLVVLDVATRTEIKRIALGRGAAGIQMQPDGERAYVACTPDDYVAVIDLHTLAVVGRINAGARPDGLAWAIRH